MKGEIIKIFGNRMTAYCRHRMNHRRIRTPSNKGEYKMRSKTAKSQTNGFEGVVVGTSNKSAVAAARRVAAGPADDRMNPLVLMGPSGCGKTRILNAIAAEVAAMQDGRVVISTTGQMFLDEYIKALECGNVICFRDKFKLADVLIVDDAEAFEKGRYFLDEVLGIFDELIGDGRQVVVTFAKPLKNLKKLNGKLHERIMSSAVIKLDYPDKTMKRRYVKSYLADKKAKLPDATVTDIMNLSAKSFWEIKGAVCTALCEKRC